MDDFDNKFDFDYASDEDVVGLDYDYTTKANSSHVQLIEDKLREIESETEKLEKLCNEADEQVQSLPVIDNKMAVDSRSVYVGNVDYSANAAELENHFISCGFIQRVSIICDKFSGNPKGFAYIEFEDTTSVKMALNLNDSVFKGRQIKVCCKRTNLPGISSTDRPVRGRSWARVFRGFVAPVRHRRKSATWFVPYKPKPFTRFSMFNKFKYSRMY